MRMTAIVILLSGLSTAAFHACAADSKDETLIRALLMEQSVAWNRGDGQAWASQFTDDADFVNIRGDVLRGSAEISRKITGVLSATFRGSHLTLTIRRFTLLNPGVALIDANYDLSGFGPLAPGMVPTEDKVLRTRMKYVAVKRSGQWRFVAAQNTAIVGTANIRP